MWNQSSLIRFQNLKAEIDKKRRWNKKEKKMRKKDKVERRKGRKKEKNKGRRKGSNVVLRILLKEMFKKWRLNYKVLIANVKIHSIEHWRHAKTCNANKMGFGILLRNKYERNQRKYN